MDRVCCLDVIFVSIDTVAVSGSKFLCLLTERFKKTKPTRRGKSQARLVKDESMTFCVLGVVYILKQ